MSIEDVIKATVEEYLTLMRREGFYYGPKGNRIFDAHAYDINNGLCNDFADTIESRVDGAEGLWMEEIDPKYEDYSHCVIRYNGRFYDAECPQGVDSLDALPLVKNRGRTREQIIAD
jgi:hypothetical protein